jgi:hypothetical protein
MWQHRSALRIAIGWFVQNGVIHTTTMCEEDNKTSGIFSSGMWLRVVWYKFTEFLKNRTTSIFREFSSCSASPSSLKMVEVRSSEMS